MDLTKLGRTEQVLAGAGLLAFIFSFFTWVTGSITVPGEGSSSGSSDAWQDPSGFNDWFPILLLLVYGIILFLPALGVAVPIPALAQASTRAFIGLVISALGVLLWVIQALTYPSLSDLESSSGMSSAEIAAAHITGSVSLEYGYYIVLVLGLAAGVQSYLGFKQAGGSFARIGDAFKARTAAVQAQQTPAYGAPAQPGAEQPQAPYAQPPQDPQQPPQAPYGS